jgi:hypothetical protein
VNDAYTAILPALLPLLGLRFGLSETLLCKAYLAGPPAIIDAAGPLLLERSMRAADIHAGVFFTPERQAA